MDRRFDLADSVIGLVTGFTQAESSSTGFQLSMLAKGVEQTFDVVKEVYDLQFSADYFPYPCLGEILFLAVLDARGVVTELVNVNDLTAPNNPIKTGLVLGTYRMFVVKITKDTPRIGDILRIEGARVVFTDFERHAASGAICYVLHAGKMPAPADGVSFELAADSNVYTWDWTTGLAPFSRCSREEAAAKRFPTRAFVGSLADIGKNCYWVGFYSTRGDEDKCDLVKCFLNAPPGWE